MVIEKGTLFLPFSPHHFFGIGFLIERHISDALFVI